MRRDPCPPLLCRGPEVPYPGDMSTDDDTRRDAAPGRDLDERELVDGLARGDLGAIDDFLSRTHHPVFIMSGRLVSDTDLRQDWTHDVLLGILDDLRLGRFVYRRPGSFWAWFRKRAYFRLLDAYRSHRVRQHREAGEASFDDTALASVTGGADPAIELERTELRAALEACLGTLSNARHRDALWHLLVEDLSYQGIAERMSTPLNTVRAWIRRGRLTLRECLATRLGLTWTGESDGERS